MSERDVEQKIAQALFADLVESMGLKDEKATAAAFLKAESAGYAGRLAPAVRRLMQRTWWAAANECARQEGFPLGLSSADWNVPDVPWDALLGSVREEGNG